VIGPADQVTVPDVVGLTEEEARIDLRDANLEPVTEGVADPAPVGQVLAQDPAAGREVDEDSRVTLRVSTGPEQKAVPGVVGRTEDEARFILVGAGFQVGDVARQRDEQAPAGEVLSQSPQADTVVDTGSTVTLVVSSGPAPVTVPDVRTLPEGAAIESLSRAGLDPERGPDQPNDLVPAGAVVNTDPAPGTSVRRDSRVQYFLSSGPATTTTSSTSTTSTTEPDGGGGGGGGGGD